ncbi:MAG: tetratricopeptide repeat protein [Desulfonatronovibrionaceae bacterium]
MNKDQLNIYDQVFRHFFLQMGGCMFLVSPDVTIQRTLKACFKYLGQEQDFLFIHHSLTTAVAEAQKNLKRFKTIIFFIESRVEDKSNVLEFPALKETFKEKAKLICLTNEVGRDTIVQIYEMGADNVIVKPASVNAIIQKVALTVKPNTSLSQHIEKCQEYMDGGDLDKADEMADKVLEEKPDSAAGLMLKGDISFKRKDMSAAEEFYIRAANQNKMYLKPLNKLVALYESLNDPEKKLKFLKRLDNLSPLNHKRKVKIGETYLDLDQDDEAREFFDQAVRQVQKQAADLLSSVLMDIARSTREKRPEMATEFIARAIDAKGEMLNKEDLWMFNEMGINLRHQGKWQQAIEYYQQALKIAPMDGGLYYNIGMAYLQGEHFYRAMQNFEKAVELQPELLENHPNVPYQIAFTHYKMKKIPEAEKYAKIALRLKPGMQNAKNLLKKIGA